MKSDGKQDNDLFVYLFCKISQTKSIKVVPESLNARTQLAETSTIQQILNQQHSSYG